MTKPQPIRTVRNYLTMVQVCLFVKLIIALMLLVSATRAHDDCDDPTHKDMCKSGDNQSPINLSQPWTDLHKLRVQFSMFNETIQKPKLTNANRIGRFYINQFHNQLITDCNNLFHHRCVNLGTAHSSGQSSAHDSE